MTKKKETTVPARSETPRAAIREALSGRPLTVREISARVGLREKEVLGHLEHLERSVRREGARLTIAPAKCLACGFEFRQRARFTTPGSCPECRSERITAPAFQIEGTS
jgi:hypothetical protein